MERQEIMETLNAAKSYLERLQMLNNELEKGRKQILTTFQEAQNNIKQTFKNLKNNLINCLNQREDHLLNQVEQIKTENLPPLMECQKIIYNKIEFTNNLINVDDFLKSHSMEEFTVNAAQLGTLPEVPELKEVPFITFCCNFAYEIEIEEILKNLGHVYKVSPVQIKELREKPGAIEILWDNLDDEHLTDIHEYRLQQVCGDITKDIHIAKHFVDCYRGLDTEFLLKDLKTSQPYSFRVGCKYEGASEWSPWSLPQVFATTLKPYTFQNNPNYYLSNENKIATSPNKTQSILLSDGAQFAIGHSIEFTFLEVDKDCMVIGLIKEENVTGQLTDLSSIKNGSFFLNHHGKIFIDGNEKLTVLPRIIKGTKVCFSCNLVNEEKVRVNVDSSDKRVTYDWPISPDSKLYFAAQFDCKWKILVE